MYKELDINGGEVDCPKYGKLVPWTWCQNCFSLVETIRERKQTCPNKIRCVYNVRKRNARS